MTATPEGEPLGSHGDITFTVRGTDCFDQLEPLWLNLFDDHKAIGNAGFRGIPRDQSWGRRRHLYDQIFAADPNAFVALAEHDGEAVGYALCHFKEGRDDTWDTGDWIGEVETLVVAPVARGGGVGTALLDAAEAELGRRGASDLLIAVLEGNERALEFYRRRDMNPTVTYLMRMAPPES